MTGLAQEWLLLFLSLFHIIPIFIHMFLLLQPNSNGLQPTCPNPTRFLDAASLQLTPPHTKITSGPTKFVRLCFGEKSPNKASTVCCGYGLGCHYNYMRAIVCRVCPGVLSSIMCLVVRLSAATVCGCVCVIASCLLSCLLSCLACNNNGYIFVTLNCPVGKNCSQAIHLQWCFCLKLSLQSANICYIMCFMLKEQNNNHNKH